MPAHDRRTCCKALRLVPSFEPDEHHTCLCSSQIEVGQGAFAVVHRCVLRRDASASFGGGASGKGGARRRQLVAVKQLKPAVLENEVELHGFIAETCGERA